MSNQEEYRRKAADCLRVAEATTDVAARVMLLEMAQAWRHLADQAERNSKADVVYEMPRSEAVVVLQQQQIQPKEKE